MIRALLDSVQMANPAPGSKPQAESGKTPPLWEPPIPTGSIGPGGAPSEIPAERGATAGGVRENSAPVGAPDSNGISPGAPPSRIAASCALVFQSARRNLSAAAE